MAKSPCVEICQLNAERKVCVGCYRTLDEIARWAEMSDAERETVLAALAQRRPAGEASRGGI